MLGVISYDPLVHIEVGPLSISPHGIGIAVGFLIGARLLLPAAKAKGMTEDDVYACLTRAAIGAIVGARLAYAVNHAGDFDSVLEVLKVWEGGISLLGGIFGAIAAAMPEMKKRGMSFWKAMDAAAPGMALGITIGRIGDLVVADHLGKVTDFFLGYRCPPASVETASRCVSGTIVHQTALYDLLLTAVLLAVLLRLRRTHRFDGFLIMVFGAWYGTQRIIEDFLREDVRHFGLTGSQMTAIVTVVVCLSWLVLARRTPRWGRWDDKRAEADATGSEAGTPDEPGAPGKAEALEEPDVRHEPDVPHPLEEPGVPDELDEPDELGERAGAEAAEAPRPAPTMAAPGEQNEEE
ncbi:MAG TPA: prolipoprotein diacylglyceryl transferase [Acidimicrobiales bacterium]|nr:prolipoprotein diacylglyceryl transferase [Acidimicrobiales bacterium]